MENDDTEHRAGRNAGRAKSVVSLVKALVLESAALGYVLQFFSANVTRFTLSRDTFVKRLSNI